VDIIALVEFTLEVWQAHHNGQVLPDITCPQAQGFTDKAWGTELSARYFAAFGAENTLALKAIEVLGEAAAVGKKVVALNKEHEESVNLIERVEDTQKVAGLTVSS